MKQWLSKIRNYTLLFSGLSFAILLYPGTASAQIGIGSFFPNYKPFGGKVNFMLPCYCSSEWQNIGAILIVGDPVGGRFYYQVGETRLYKNFQPIFTHWVLGLADENDKEWCKFEYEGVCIPYYRASVIKHMGTS